MKKSFSKCTNVPLQSEHCKYNSSSFCLGSKQQLTVPETQRTCWGEQEPLLRLCLSGLNSHFSFAPLYLDAPSREVVKQCLPHQQPGEGEGD